jgi:hypothetical protein
VTACRLKKFVSNLERQSKHGLNGLGPAKIAGRIQHHVEQITLRKQRQGILPVCDQLLIEALIKKSYTDLY